MNIPPPPPPPPPPGYYEGKMRDMLAEIVLVELIRKGVHLDIVANTSYAIADRMIQERRAY